LSAAAKSFLAGFYSETMSFRFTPAFMREAQFRIAAEFKPA
jgi:3-hydroxyethyl bacteriochlorophyllide a dehydrogenase